MESLAALVNGAIAFDSPADGQQAKGDQSYALYPDLAHSQRGVNILLDLPSGNNLSENRTPLMYQGLQVGTLTKLTLQQDSKVVGELTIDPSVVDLMRSGTHRDAQPAHQPQRRQAQPTADRHHAGAGTGEGEPQRASTCWTAARRCCNSLAC